MDEQRAQQLLQAERQRVEGLLEASVPADEEDRTDVDEPRDNGDMAQELNLGGVGDAIQESLRERLAALDRADERLAAGTYGTSIQSGAPIPDARLEADPAAELTVEEAAAQEASDETAV
jgi:DnaK suppressor protein